MTATRTISSRLFAVLLASTALVGTPALAQAAPPETQPDASPPVAAPVGADSDDFEVSAPGGGGLDEIVVIGTRIPNTVRSSRQVVSVLTQADIARTGEGDIAGALQRLSGLSVVGNRFVYVRGLGERYSLALLNGLPIPSPDPLRRVVPLDIFPTSIVASAVVQKSYSVNFPGEFGGGVINLTSRAIPTESFLTVGGSIGGDTVTTSELGYVYPGGDWDVFGYDDGTRSVPLGLVDAGRNGKRLSATGGDFTFREVQDITASLTNTATTLIQRNFSIQPNFSLDFAAGHKWDVGDLRFGVIANLGWSNNWQTRSGVQQNSITFIPPDATDAQLGFNQNYQFLSTENRAVVNGLLGLGLEFGENRIRINNVYVNDTIKEARIQDGTNDAAFTDPRVNISNTAWFQRILFQTQAVAELRFDNISVDLRGTYANSKRLSPYERTITYAFDDDPERGIFDFINDLRSPGQNARVAFSRLNENVWGGGIDLGYELDNGPFPMKFTAGYAYSDNQRTSTRRDYRYQSAAALPLAVAQQRPDFLLSDFNIYTYGIVLQEETNAEAGRYDAGLTVHAGYGQIELEPADGVQIQGGVRFESGDQFVAPINLFGGAQPQASTIRNDYWLPAATVTWNFAADMQLRASASKTIARPQFRELAPQVFLDTDTDRLSRGNQFLVDSELINAELRYEWYFGKDERFSVSGFWKQIDRPIETVVSVVAGAIETTFANAPKAELYGAELDAQKYFPLDFVSDSAFFSGRRFMVGANYTYTNSQLKVSADDTTIFPFTGQVIPATEFFRNGQPLTGQSDHVANLQLGFSDQDSLSEQTLLLNYASDRSTSRGPAGQPDLVERPGLRLDVVIRQGFDLGGVFMELKLEGRNLTGVRYQEFQSLNGSRIDTNTYALGRVFRAGLSATF
jgi:TonB-dependent receptor